MCLNLCVFSAILLGILYLFFGAFPLVFGNVYGFSLWQCGCCFLGLFVGMALAIFSDPVWRRNYVRLEQQHANAVGRPDDFQPEWRLPPGTFGPALRLLSFFLSFLHANDGLPGSNRRCAPRHHWLVHLCLDDISQCPLDWAGYRCWRIRSRVRESLHE